MQNTLTFDELIGMRNALMISQKEIYITAITNINMRYRELLKNDFGSALVRNCAWDIADTLAKEYFKTSDYYVSPQQLYERIVYFKYEDDTDLLNSNAAIRKILYQNNTSKEVLQDIFDQSCKAGKILFTDTRKNDSLEKETKAYRDKRIAENRLTDDITGREGSYYIRVKNGKEERVSNLHADHVQARDSAKFDSRYIKEEHIQDMRDFFYSDQNFWMIHASANTSKGAVRVCNTDNGIVYMSDKEFKNAVNAGKLTAQNDITWKATPEQMADATIQMWEKETPSSQKTEKLMEEGYLDSTGHVRPEVREKLIKTFQKSMDAESLFMLLPYYDEDEHGNKKLHSRMDYKAIMDDAWEYSRKSAKKMLAGQVIYYVLPPLVFETKAIVRKKGMTIEQFFVEIKKSGSRVLKYVTSRIGQIFKNLIGNGFNKFLNSFFDILIEAVKATVKKLLKIAKKLVLSLVNCVKTIAGKGTAAEKADAVTKTLAVTVSTAALEVLFEWAEKQYKLPDTIMEPLQIIVTILSTNLIMLILQKADLFDVQYGLLVSNIEQAFNEEHETYLEQTQRITTYSEEQMSMYFEDLTKQIHEMEVSIESVNLYEDDATQTLNQLNKIYNMGIDFDQEWSEYLAHT